jgi:hypothetical protein
MELKRVPPTPRGKTGGPIGVKIELETARTRTDIFDMFVAFLEIGFFG